MDRFVPLPALVTGLAPLRCKAVVVIPARNEESTLCSTLDSLSTQQETTGQLLEPGTFEVIVLLNNCTDGSADVAARWQVDHPTLALQICERTFVAEQAHVGTARRLLMDTAWSRLQGNRGCCGILTTDADTLPSPDWVFRNLEALREGAHVVGGAIDLDCSALPPAVRRAYLQDREYQRVVAELEHMLDPQEGDPLPRHLEHFGGSLACTPEAYVLAGGMPDVAQLEDVAFIDRLRRADARIRHDPRVKVFTSARLCGRVSTGLSGQLRSWQLMSETDAEHQVRAAEYLEHRFTLLCELRCFFRTGDERLLNRYATGLLGDFHAARAYATTCGAFLAQVDCNRLVDASFRGKREEPIACAIQAIQQMLAADQVLV